MILMEIGIRRRHGDAFPYPRMRSAVGKLVENWAQNRFSPESSLFLYVPVAQLLLSNTTGVSRRDHLQTEPLSPFQAVRGAAFRRKSAGACAIFRRTCDYGPVISPVTILFFQASGGLCPKDVTSLQQPTTIRDRWGKLVRRNDFSILLHPEHDVGRSVRRRRS